MNDTFSIYFSENTQVQFTKQKNRKLSDKDTNDDSDQERNQNWQIYLSQFHPLKQIKHVNNKKLKNQLCKNHIKYGNCHYGSRCQFAHGIDELRKNQNQNSKYKTKQCLSYFKDGVCMYGMRCNFNHATKNKQLKKPIKQSLQELMNHYPQLLTLQRPRLKFFQSFDEKF